MMNKERWMFILAALILAGAMILTSCNGANGVDDGGTDKQEALDHDNSATALISPETGGMIDTFGWDGTRYSLSIPPNALLTEKEIILIPIIDIFGLPYGLFATAAVQIEPDGLYLMSPATLTIELLSQVPDIFLGFLFQNNGEEFHLYPIKIDGNKFSFNLMHFTRAGGFIADCGVIIAWDVNTWLTQEDRAQQRMAILEAWMQHCETWVMEEIEKAIMEIHYDWFFDSGGVGRLVDEAYNDPEGFLDRAINQLNSWYFSCVLSDFVLDIPGLMPDLVPFTQPINCGHPDGILCSDLDDVAEAAAAKLFEVFKKAVTNANDRCISGGQSQDEEALDLIEKACWLELDWNFLYEHYFDFEELVDLKTCGIWELEIETGSKTIGIDETLQLKAVAKDKQGNPLYEPEVRWRSNDEDVAIVTEEGIVSGVSAGIVKIYAYLDSPSGCPLYQGEAEITVEGTIVGHWEVTQLSEEEGEETYPLEIYEDGRICKDIYSDDEWGEWTLIGKNVELKFKENGADEDVTLTGTVNDQCNEMSGTWIEPDYPDPEDCPKGTWHAVKKSDIPRPLEGR